MKVLLAILIVVLGILVFCGATSVGAAKSDVLSVSSSTLVVGEVAIVRVEKGGKGWSELFLEVIGPDGTNEGYVFAPRPENGVFEWNWTAQRSGEHTVRLMIKHAQWNWYNTELELLVVE